MEHLGHSRPASQLSRDIQMPGKVAGKGSHSELRPYRLCALESSLRHISQRPTEHSVDHKRSENPGLSEFRLPLPLKWEEELTVKDPYFENPSDGNN